MSVLDMMKSNPEPLSPPLLKLVLKRLLTTLDSLHTKANIIHTGKVTCPIPCGVVSNSDILDLKADNLMLSIEDESMLEEFEKAELENPSPRKIIDGTRSIYKSRNLPKPKNGKWGLPFLCDFGEARIGNIQVTSPFVQPQIYRAPEVTFEMHWGPPVDIWNVAALVNILLPCIAI